MISSIPLFQVDAFTSRVFSGNPAAVCVLRAWLDDDVLQQIARENNVSETAFVVADETGAADFELRWFTPFSEINLCGHATLATAWVLFRERGLDADKVTFRTRESGILSVAQGQDDILVMDFPAYAPRPAPHHTHLESALGGMRALEFYVAPNGMALAVLASQDDVKGLRPRMASVAELGDKGLIVTARGDAGAGIDFVSRYFTPKEGIAEDPVTGAAHCVLTPYWARRLKQDQFRARQLSARGGDVFCALKGARVELSGYAALYMKGEAFIPSVHPPKQGNRI